MIKNLKKPKKLKILVSRTTRKQKSEPKLIAKKTPVVDQTNNFETGIGQKWFYPSWDRVGIVSLLMATGVAVWAVISSSNDAREQRDVMRDQLKQMQMTGIQTDKLIATNLQNAEAANTSAKISSDSLIANNRAWIGTSIAYLSSKPMFGQPADISILYLNTGREPALEFNYDSYSIVSNPQDLERGKTEEFISNYASQCFQKKTSAGQVVFPSANNTWTEMKSPLLQNALSERVIKGEDTLFFLGCFTYLTRNITRHSAFCYYFNSVSSNFARLNFCTFGMKAD